MSNGDKDVKKCSLSYSAPRNGESPLSGARIIEFKFWLHNLVTATLERMLQLFGLQDL